MISFSSWYGFPILRLISFVQAQLLAINPGVLGQQAVAAKAAPAPQPTTAATAKAPTSAAAKPWAAPAPDHFTDGALAEKGSKNGSNGLKKFEVSFILLITLICQAWGSSNLGEDVDLDSVCCVVQANISGRHLTMNSCFGFFWNMLLIRTL